MMPRAGHNHYAVPMDRPVSLIPTGGHGGDGDALRGVQGSGCELVSAASRLATADPRRVAMRHINNPKSRLEQASHFI